MDSVTTVIFGDVHGDVGKLRTLIGQVRTQFGPGPDTCGRSLDIYGLGDFVDRGPDSREVIDLCIQEGVKGILGNHELWLCSVLSGRPMSDEPYSNIMGGLATIKSYGLYRGDPDRVGIALRNAVPKAHKEWLLSLLTCRFIEVAGVRYMLTHAGVRADHWAQLRGANPAFPEMAVPGFLAEKATGPYFWVGAPPRKQDEVAKFDGYTQVFGHTPCKAPVVVPGHYVALDTGCGTCPPYSLSALVLSPDGRVETMTIR